MQLLFEIGQIFLTTFSLALVMPMFWIVLFLVFLQYRRQNMIEEKFYGRVINPLGRQMLTSVGLGALGGLAASIALVFLGLSLEQIGLYFIWPVALLLLLINPRYLCFSYAGGLVAGAVLISRHILVPLLPDLASLSFFEALLKIHIPALLVLIGLLHLVEALLIYSGGHWGSSPVYLKQDNGKVVGAYVLQRFWPLPLVALLVSLVPQTEVVGVSMPEWWPILQSVLQPEEGHSLQYMIIPVAAGLGYADMALTSDPLQRSRFSARWLALYSVILLLVALASEFLPVLILPGVVFAPLGHELLILYGKKREERETPLYESSGTGLKVMMILKGSAAEEAGLQKDDLIEKVNSREIRDFNELMQQIEESYFMVLLQGMRQDQPFSLVMKKHYAEEQEKSELLHSGRSRSSAYYLLHRSASLGLIPVPPADSPVYMELKKPGSRRLFKKAGSRLKKLFKG